MKANVVCTSLNIADSTLRKYAQEYAEYLSPSAAGGARHHRDYLDHDVRVLKYVNDLRRANMSNEDIIATLNNMRDGGWERLPKLDESETAIVASPSAVLALQTERAVLVKEVEMLREQINDLKSERKERDELVRKLAEKELMLKLYEEGTLKFPREMQ